MDTNETSVIVALIPQDDSWCKIEPAHMTMIYVGETTNLKPTRFNELAKDVSSISMLMNPIMAKVSGTDVLGEEERVDVMMISPTPEILAIRRLLEQWDDGNFPEFLPHVTVGPEGSLMNWSSQMNERPPYPMYLNFDRIAVFWGSERLNFWLKKY